MIGALSKPAPGVAWDAPMQRFSGRNISSEHTRQICTIIIREHHLGHKSEASIRILGSRTDSEKTQLIPTTGEESVAKHITEPSGYRKELQ